MSNKYLKGRKKFWTILSCAFDSTCWKEMLRFRQELFPLVKYSLGTDSDIKFWLDPWVGKVPLIDVLGMKNVAAIGDPKAIVDKFIVAGNWNLPICSNSAVNQLWASIKKIEIPNQNFSKDTYVWINSTSGFFSFKVAFHDLRSHYPIVDWAKLIWSSNCIPKHSCCANKVVMSRLPTVDILQWMQS